MESKIIQDFEGEINGIKFYDQYIFNTTEYLAEEIEKKFGEIDTELIKDLKEAAETLYEKYDIFSFDSFENETMENLGEANTLKEFKLTYEKSDWKLEKINQNLKNEKYKSEKENSSDKEQEVSEKNLKPNLNLKELEGKGGQYEKRNSRKRSYRNS